MNSNAKKRNPYDAAREILEEQGFESGDYFDDGFGEERCSWCGGVIAQGHVKAQVYTTGDLIHEGCWQDYAEANFDELCCVLGD